MPVSWGPEEVKVCGLLVEILQLQCFHNFSELIFHQLVVLLSVRMVLDENRAGICKPAFLHQPLREGLVTSSNNQIGREHPPLGTLILC